MARTLYSPRLSDDVVRALYHEGRRRRMPMTRLADELLRQSLAAKDTGATPMPEPATASTPPVADAA